MRSAFVAASVLSLASIAAAQSGYGRFPCTIVNDDGTFSPDASQCSNDALVNPGDNVDNTGNQGDRVTPVNPQCAQELESGAYFCGIAGATCTTNSNCDGGPCVDGICQGGFEQACGSDDANCSGFLYCLNQDFETSSSDTCGGIGAFCQDSTQGSIADFTDAENYAIFNQFCSSGYCNFGTGTCDVHATTVGADCSNDEQFKCTQTSTGQALTCDTTTFTCQLAQVPSGRARARRNLSKRNLCPSANEEACAISGGFDCIDTTSNLENCGGCAGKGGVDCTQLEGVSSASCENSVCSIWACADGFVFDADSQACVAV
ncbi:hypothetical protein JCM3766R1_003282 [Sporobolomyces carnicolor]